MIMTTYCPHCGHPVAMVEKDDETLPVCTVCKAEIRDSGLGWSKKVRTVKMDAKADVHVADEKEKE